ncbi:MAG: GTPase HflX [Candidatus Omnitrophota bacterium]
MERALLVTLKIKQDKNPWKPEDSASELCELVVSLGAEVAHEVIAARESPTPAHYIGKGKAEEIADICREKKINIVIFNGDLTGTQQKNLENIIGVKTIDRTQLILDIFAKRARSNEGKIEIELAQLLYLLPRLTGKGIILSRLGGGIGTRGPGEQKLEVDRRKVRERITKLKEMLKKACLQRATRRLQRDNFSLLSIAVIGYTNSGKSTLMNALTKSEIYTKNRLFSTLDPTARGFVLPNNQKVVFTDTVGFLHNLPHHLIESFKATLEEVVNADVLLHIIDVSHPKAKEMERAVFQVLKEIKADDKPVITVLNKIDKIDENELRFAAGNFENGIEISALKKINLEKIADKVVLYLNELVKTYKITLPQSKASLINLIYEHGHVVKREYREDKVDLEVELPVKFYQSVSKEI